ncbi:MAG: tetratricopeptide repeat protein [Bacteroidales bacterium]|nr:tetratricopeptide repeat protein [Bacteroidales bacterium]
MLKHMIAGLLVLLIITSCGNNVNEADNYLESGLAKMYQSRFSEALLDFDKAISLDPESAKSYFYRGNCLQNMGKSDASMKAYDQCLQLDSTYTDAYYNRGLLKEYLLDYNGACADFRKAASLGKPNIDDKTRRCN